MIIVIMVYTKSYAAPTVDREAILRYASVKETDTAIETLIDECLDEISGKLVYKICYREFPIHVNEKMLDLTFTKTYSSSLQRNLRRCERVVLFAATVGIEIDRAIIRYSATSPSKAFIFQAIGTERIESLCDNFERDICEEYKGKGFFVRPRFSAGYGDFSLEAQKDIFSVLDCQRTIGLVLNKSLLMSPSKSVTALIGIGREADGLQEKK